MPNDIISPDVILKIDKARVEGLSHMEILASLEHAEEPNPVEVMKEYALTPLKDGRLRGNVNLGDQAEWDR